LLAGRHLVRRLATVRGGFGLIRRDALPVLLGAFLGVFLRVRVAFLLVTPAVFRTTGVDLVIRADLAFGSRITVGTRASLIAATLLGRVGVAMG